MGQAASVADGVGEAVGGGGANSKRVEAVVASPGLLSLHSEEASLEDIFIKLTGRGLDA